MAIHLSSDNDTIGNAVLITGIYKRHDLFSPCSQGNGRTNRECWCFVLEVLHTGKLQIGLHVVLSNDEGIQHCIAHRKS